MKFTKLLFLACIAFLLSFNAVFAQGKKNNAETRAKTYTEDLTKFLGLNGEQAKKILAINAEINKKLDAGAKGGNQKLLRADRKKRIIEVLTPAQKAKFEKQFEQGQGKGKEKGKNKKDEDDDDGIFGK